MAKNDTSKMVLERTYNVPLRKEYQKVAYWKRTKKAVTAMRQFIIKHMKSENVKLGKELNDKLWQHGIRNPPHHVKITVTKNDQGEVRAELFGITKKDKKTVKKEELVPEEKEEHAHKEQSTEEHSHEKKGKKAAHSHKH
ncbi:MAG: 50S ribosomal protein L31e [Nanoarchaeota archaeon]|nr:50S ribosomal protein L31e [Nanoarchaeota archaeon]